MGSCCLHCPGALTAAKVPLPPVGSARDRPCHVQKCGFPRLGLRIWWLLEISRARWRNYAGEACRSGDSLNDGCHADLEKLLCDYLRGGISCNYTSAVYAVYGGL